MYFTVFGKIHPTNEAWFPYDIFLHAIRRPSLLLSDRFCFEFPLDDAIFTQSSANAGSSPTQLILSPNALVSAFLLKHDNDSILPNFLKAIFENLTETNQRKIKYLTLSKKFPTDGFDLDARFIFPNDYRYMSGKCQNFKIFLFIFPNDYRYMSGKCQNFFIHFPKRLSIHVW